jgi:outer membrane protein assembly factor BamB
MDKKIKIFLLTVILIIGGVVIFDLVSNRVINRPDNPYEYSVEEFKTVNAESISYREVRQISVGQATPVAIAYSNGKIYLLLGGRLRVISPEGHELFSMNIEDGASRIAPDKDDSFIIAYENYLVRYSSSGSEISRSETLGDKAYLVSLGIVDDRIFAGDGGGKVVHIFDNQLNKRSQFKGESGVSAVHGFILPSNQFDMAVNADGELWIVNPGLHTIQNYSVEGRMRGSWGVPSFNLEGFSGCCNPSYIAFLSDGRYVTGEKGLVRVKIHKVSGEFESVVAPAEKFQNGEKAPALAVDGEDNIWLLDFDKKLLRLFKPSAVSADVVQSN